jgi:nicotinamidase-related amidase
MLMRADTSCLLIVDLQEKLVPALHESEILVKNARWLIDAAKVIGVPIVASEQYPKGLSGTVPIVAESLPKGAIVSKEHFSCVAAGCLKDTAIGDRIQVVICGAESHVCVLQTAIELKESGKEVFVVADAVSSRHLVDKELALARMRAAGVIVVSREMVIFEWLSKAGTDLFRQVSREFLR